MTYPPEIGGKMIDKWDQLWQRVEGGFTYHPHLRHVVGLYRAVWNGQVMALGTGIDKSGGLAKRPSDYSRPSSSARNHHAGKLIYENLSVLELEILITGRGRMAAEVAERLKAPMLQRHRPPWSIFDPEYRAEPAVEVVSL